MLSPEQLFGFLAAAVLITLSPGPDNLMVLSTGIAKGRLRGIAFGLGCAFGCISHTVLAVIGISALIAASPAAFTALKVAGGLYLIWMGWGAVKSRGGARVTTACASDEPAGRLFVKGLVAAAINPKVVLFFLSFLPQFVIAARGDANLQIGLLGIVFTLQAALIFGALGYFSGTIGQWLNRTPTAGMWLDRIAGAVFIGLGLRLIVAR
ncbi:LysE family translocator [Massilia timonae]|uniref:LysE family translocator n=1 Tax=Massilia timonae TaxID=47229 RepID=UPI000EE5A0F4|nr:LysE family translocator [Massilia timonae]HAK92932.1 lysine transporter LysE [Massilia timonae]